MSEKTTLTTVTELTVSTKPGEFVSNIAELKAAVIAKVEEYKNTQYIAEKENDQVKLMKNDRAALNKLVKAIDQKRVCIKKDYLRPYEAFELEVKDVLTAIKKQTDILDTVISDFENRAKEEKRTAIRSYYNEIVQDVPEDFREELYTLLYDSKWENATATQKAYKEHLSAGVTNYVKGMETLALMKSDYLEEGINEFKKTLSLQDALLVIRTQEEKRDALLKKEKERLEREAEEKAKAAIQKERDAIMEQARLNAAKENAEKIANLEAQKNQLLKEAKETSQTSTVSNSLSSYTKTISSLPKNCIQVTFNVKSWETVKEFCDEEGIGYTVVK